MVPKGILYVRQKKAVEEDKEGGLGKFETTHARSGRLGRLDVFGVGPIPCGLSARVLFGRHRARCSTTGMGRSMVLSVLFLVHCLDWRLFLSHGFVDGDYWKYLGHSIGYQGIDRLGGWNFSARLVVQCHCRSPRIGRHGRQQFDWE